MSFLADPNLLDKCLEKLQKYEAKQSRLRKKFGIETPTKTIYQNIQRESPIPISPIHSSPHEINKSSILSPFSDEKDSNTTDSILGPSFSSTPIKYHSSPHEGDPEFPAVTGLFSTTITGRSSTRKMSVLKNLSIVSEDCNKRDEDNKLENSLNQLNTSMESMSISFQIPHTPIHQYNSNNRKSNSLERSRSFHHKRESISSYSSQDSSNSFSYNINHIKSLENNYINDSNKENENDSANERIIKRISYASSKSYSQSSLPTTPEGSMDKKENNCNNNSSLNSQSSLQTSTDNSIDNEEDNDNKMKDILTPLPTRNIIYNNNNNIFNTPINKINNNDNSSLNSESSIPISPNDSINEDDEEEDNHNMKDILTPLPTRNIIYNNNNIYTTPISSTKKKIIYLKPTPMKMGNSPPKFSSSDDKIEINVRNRDKYTKEAYEEFDKRIFHFKEKIPITFTNKLVTTAGRCFCHRKKYTDDEDDDDDVVINKYKGKHASVELSIKVIDTLERLKTTLLHELCHAASWLNYGDKGHTGAFTYYKHQCNNIYKDAVTTYHSYHIFFKYRYECVDCHHIYGRHSNSIDRCGKCGGRITELGKFKKDGTPMVNRTLSGFSLFMKENYHIIKEKNQNISHKEIMKILSEEWKKNKMNNNQ